MRADVARFFSARTILACAAAALLAGLVTITPAEANDTYVSLPLGTPALALAGSAKPVAAWVRLCERMPSECAVDRSEADVITLTPQAWTAIVAVNRRVNASIKPLTDAQQWGVVDTWDFPTTGYGDCEDYQLLKRKLLADRGLPRRAMRMTVVIDEIGEGHAVLTIRTDRGDFILDNKTNAVLPWAQTGYVYVKREGSESTAWVSLGGVTTPSQPVATANNSN